MFVVEKFALQRSAAQRGILQKALQRSAAQRGQACSAAQRSVAESTLRRVLIHTVRAHEDAPGLKGEALIFPPPSLAESLVSAP